MSGTSSKPTRTRPQPSASTGPSRRTSAGTTTSGTSSPQITDDAGELLWYDEVFYADGPPLDGPFQRALFGLVIDPDRADEYEALHANPWPDLMAAIETSGFRKYTGFRRGGHVVYYGEFYPDLTSVFGKMATYEVNARWGAAFEGIITTITDPDGNLITADEVFHQD